MPAHVGRTPFVGREPELGRLRAAFDDAAAGHGSLVMMVYYLVGSQEQADEVQAEIDQHVEGSDPSQSVVVVASSDGKALPNGAGPSYVVDLRPSAPAPEAP